MPDDSNAGFFASTVAPIVLAGSAVLTIAMEAVRRTRKLTPDQRVAKLARVRDALPAGSPMRDELDELIESEAQEIIDATGARRDPAGIVLAAMFLVLAVACLVLAVILGGWWWLLLIGTAGLGLFGAVGLAEDARKKIRD